MKDLHFLKNLFLAIIGSASFYSRTCTADPAGPPDEFGGVKWGASKQETTAAMSARGAEILPSWSNDSHLGFMGGNIAGLSAYSWDLFYAGDKFWRGGVQFKEASDLDNLFKKVKKLITDKYGTRVKESFKPGQLSAEWHLVLPPANDGILIRLWIGPADKQKRLKLEYTNEALAKLAPKEHSEKKAVEDGL
jgi:hypothetical protein